MVATRCFTYNHAPFIIDALNGFSIQEADFSMVYCIVDDASTDDEPNILRTWAENNLDLNEDGVSYREILDYGEIIVAHLKDKHNSLFVILLLSSNHKQAGKSKLQYISEWLNNSKYIAICEGDDYWTDPQKLAKQVKILESDSEIGLCYASAKVYDEDSHSFSKEIKGHRFESFEQQLLWNYIPTLTVCMRTDLRKRYEIEKRSWEEAKTWKMGDYPTWLWFCLNSKVSFLDEVVAVYRVSPGTASRPKTLAEQKAFADSTYSIQMHFATAANVDIETLDLIKRSWRKALTYIYINNDEYGRGLEEAKILPPLQRVHVLLYILKKRWFFKRFSC